MNEEITGLLQTPQEPDNQNETEQPIEETQPETIEIDKEIYLRDLALNQVPYAAHQFIGGDTKAMFEATDLREAHYQNHPEELEQLPQTSLTQDQWSMLGIRGTYDPERKFTFVPEIRGDGSIGLGDIYENGRVVARSEKLYPDKVTVPNKVFSVKHEKEQTANDEASKQNALYALATQNVPYALHNYYKNGNPDEMSVASRKREVHYAMNQKEFAELPKTTLTLDQWQMMGVEGKWGPQRKFTFIPALNRDGRSFRMSDLYDGDKRIGSGFNVDVKNVTF